jgi:hypothetical protein
MNVLLPSSARRDSSSLKTEEMLLRNICNDIPHYAASYSSMLQSWNSQPCEQRSQNSFLNTWRKTNNIWIYLDSMLVYLNSISKLYLLYCFRRLTARLWMMHWKVRILLWPSRRKPFWKCFRTNADSFENILTIRVGLQWVNIMLLFRFKCIAIFCIPMRFYTFSYSLQVVDGRNIVTFSSTAFLSHRLLMLFLSYIQLISLFLIFVYVKFFIIVIFNFNISFIWLLRAITQAVGIGFPYDRVSFNAGCLHASFVDNNLELE